MDETPHTILTARPAPPRVDPSTVALHIGHLFARSLLSAIVLTAAVALPWAVAAATGYSPDACHVAAADQTFAGLCLDFGAWSWIGGWLR